MKRTNAILGGGALKNPETGPIDVYWNQAIVSKPELAVDHQIRSIGIDEETTVLIIDFIKEGEKVVFTLKIAYYRLKITYLDSVRTETKQ